MLGTYHLTALYDLLKDLHFIHDTNKFYAYLLENLVKTVDADAASIYIADNEKKVLRLFASMGPKKQMLEMVAEEINFSFGKGISGWVAETSQAVIVDDVKNDLRHNNQVDILTGYKTKSVLCAPIANKNNVLGVIEILNKKSSAFNKNDLDLVALIARQAAIALENLRLYKDINDIRNFAEGVISNLTGGFIAVDAASTVMYINPTAEKILLLSSSRTIGTNGAEALKGYPEIYNELALVLSTKAKKVRQEVTLKRGDNAVVTIGYSTFLVQDKSGSVLGAGISFQDLTDLK